MKKETLPPYLVLSRLAPEFGLPLTSPSLGFSLEDPFSSSTTTPPINKPDHQLQFHHFLDDDLFMTVPKTAANSVASMAIEAPSGKDHVAEKFLGFDDSDLKEFSFDDSEGIVPAKAEGFLGYFVKAEVKEEPMEGGEDRDIKEEENDYEEMSLPIEEGISSDGEENRSGSSEEEEDEDEEEEEEEEEELDSDDSDFEDRKSSKRPKRGARVSSPSSKAGPHNEPEGVTTTKRGRGKKGQKRAGGRRKKAPKEPVVKERKKPGRKPKILDEETKRIRGQIRQEKNRMAARKCREKKQGYFLLLEGEVAKLRGEKEEMAKELTELRSLVQTLQAKLRGV